METFDILIGDYADECGKFPALPQVIFVSEYDFVLVESVSEGQNAIVSFDGAIGVASIYCGVDGQGVIYDLGPSRGSGMFFRVEEENNPTLLRVTLKGVRNG